MDIRKIRNDFPTLQGEHAPAYLDNACVTLKPESVLKVINDYYTQTPGCGGRSVHRYGTKISKQTSNARIKLQKFLNAQNPNEVVFTRNATHSLNQVAHGMK
ncbi:MAG: aminotransferase class V-fold PLP-dependent enzyme, partial [Candidatus Poseidoniaceae archaeon]|nr:aminotransferase class V-fold PLP-dependent enzyme [Candidatus Poseidoniaceae archaeon]